MNKRILLVGVLTCVSSLGIAQSDNSSEKKKDQTASPHEVTSPRDSATGQASGKRMHKPLLVTTDDANAQVSPTAAKAKPMASDDWQTSSKSTASKPADSPRVAAGDVNGDGAADATTQTSGQPNTTNNHEVKSPRDLASGQASGKRQQQPATGTADSDKPKQK